MPASEASQQANRSGLDPKRLVIVFYMLAAVVLGLFLDNLLGMVWGRIGWSNREVIEGLGWSVTTLIAIALALAIVVASYAHPRTHKLSLEIADELMKVTWPSWTETRTSTVAVVVASLVAAVVLFGIDTLAYKMMVDWLPTLWGKL